LTTFLKLRKSGTDRNLTMAIHFYPELKINDKEWSIDAWADHLLDFFSAGEVMAMISDSDG
jgi:hypothetical protein